MIPKGKDEAEIELQATFSAVSGGVPADMRIVATAKPSGKVITANTTTRLTTFAAPMPQADIVFVLDVTSSMQGQINGLKDSVGTFAGDLFKAKVDARFACLAFRDLTYGEMSQLLKFKGDVFTSDASAFKTEVAKLKANGGGDIPERSFEALTEAAELTDYRKAAVRTLVLITDAPPKIVVKQGQSKEVTIKSLKDIDLLHLVVNPAEVPIYTEIQQGAKGVTSDAEKVDRGKVFDLGTVATNSEAMTTKIMPDMTKAIIAAAESKRPESKPELAKRPGGQA